jgi:hypothetical protein
MWPSSPGPLVSIIGLLAVPFIWSIPQAIMSAELSLMMSENGGNIVWSDLHTNAGALPLFRPSSSL